MPARSISFQKLLGALSLTAFCGACAAVDLGAIELDGRLDEPAWQLAQRIDSFRVVQPLTRAEPPLRTEVRVLSREDGLYFGVRAQQPPEFPRTRHPTRRDAQARADRINLLVDFEGEGSTAYEFTVSLSGGVQDAIITGQNGFNYDWDGVWQQAVAEDADGWSVEVRLPWGIAPLGRIENGETTIGVYLSRVIEQQGLRMSHPAYDFENPTFVADMAKLTLAARSDLRLDVVPYLSVASDRIANSRETRAGADLYLATGGHRLNVAIKPDFGQVESDALVVDFSALEVFFGEKRPFFTENQSLFDVPLGPGALLINTRRIGARPDLGPEGVSEVDAAIKYTGAFGRVDAGVLAASEADSSLAQGREFRALRGRYRADSGEFGLTLTDTQRPSLSREAQVAVVDAQLRPREGLQLRGAAGRARVDRARADSAQGPEADGGLLWLRMDHVISERWRQEYEFSRYDDSLEVNDLGFLRRNDLSQLRAEHTLYQRNYAQASRLRDSAWEAEVLWQRNGAGERLYGGLELTRVLRFRNAATLRSYAAVTTPTVDDRVLRGAGSVALPAQHAAGLSFESPRLGNWRFDSGLYLYQEGLHGWTRELEFAPTWFIGAEFSTALSAAVSDSSDWLIWDGGSRMGQYSRRQLQLDWTLEWFPGAGHEVRLRAQYVGLDARAVTGYTVEAQRLLAAAAPSDFSLGTLAAQLRYRYELGEQRDFYLVFSRGGEYFGEDAQADGLGRLFDRTRANPTANQILAKLRWGF